MIALTAPDGTTINIDGEMVIRIRRAISGESISEGARTRIDWVQMQLVTEPPEEVAAAVKEVLDSLVFLTSRDGTRIWFNGRKATGPLRLTPSQRDGVVQSAIKIMGYRQYVVESDDEVRQLLRESGGTVLP